MPAVYLLSEVVTDPQVVARPMTSRPPTRTVGLAWRRHAARAEEYRALADIILMPADCVSPKDNIASWPHAAVSGLRLPACHFDPTSGARGESIAAGARRSAGANGSERSTTWR
jgi:hypothetical protein